jgi:hypothetical protein
MGRPPDLTGEESADFRHMLGPVAHGTPIALIRCKKRGEDDAAIATADSEGRMSTPDVIWRASDRLRTLLWETAFGGNTGPLLDNADQIVLDAPTDPTAAANGRLSIWLYRVLENEFQKNQPPGWAARADRLVPPPLALSLFYLLTPLGTTEDRRQQVLGAAMRALHDNAIVPLRDPLAQMVHEELHIGLCRLTLEETARVYEALQAPYRLSVCYEIRTVHLASTRRLDAPRVRDRRAAGEFVTA